MNCSNNTCNKSCKYRYICDNKKCHHISDCTKKYYEDIWSWQCMSCKNINLTNIGKLCEKYFKDRGIDIKNGCTGFFATPYCSSLYLCNDCKNFFCGKDTWKYYNECPYCESNNASTFEFTLSYLEEHIKLNKN